MTGNLFFDFTQDVAAINVEAGHAVFLGDVAQRVVCTPDVDQLLADKEIDEWERVGDSKLPGLKPSATRLPEHGFSLSKFSAEVNVNVKEEAK